MHHIYTACVYWVYVRYGKCCLVQFRRSRRGKCGIFVIFLFSLCTFLWEHYSPFLCTYSYAWFDIEHLQLQFFRFIYNWSPERTTLPAIIMIASTPKRTQKILRQYQTILKRKIKILALKSNISASVGKY